MKNWKRRKNYKPGACFCASFESVCVVFVCLRMRRKKTRTIRRREVDKHVVENNIRERARDLGEHGKERFARGNEKSFGNGEADRAEG